jgi:uncharacterized membrane protein YdfJ with MMPL/SSD domain
VLFVIFKSLSYVCFVSVFLAFVALAVLPAILAICGFVFLVRDGWRGLIRKSASS